MTQVAMTILSDAPDAPLSPFFARAPWIAVFDIASGMRTLIRNAPQEAEFIIDQVCRIRPRALVCGHIDPASAARLNRAGVLLKLGPCSRPASTLLHGFNGLPGYEKT